MNAIILHVARAHPIPLNDGNIPFFYKGLNIMI